jgi:hypothetical protein
MMFNSKVPPRPRLPVTKPLPARPIARVLEAESGLSDWMSRHRQEVALTRLVRKHLPRPIAERVHVSDSRNGVLELAATAGAIAATLRQRAPNLRASLLRDGVDFTEVRIRVQVAARPEMITKNVVRQWDSASAKPLFDLADRLSESPLKGALARWSRRARGR